MTMTLPSNEDDLRLVAALRAGDEMAFETLIDRYSPALLRLARMYVSSLALAEDVVQETWVAVLQGLSRFENRSSLKTWIYRILVTRARTRGQRESHSVPFPTLSSADADPAEPAVDADRFFPADGKY